MAVFLWHNQLKINLQGFCNIRPLSLSSTVVFQSPWRRNIMSEKFLWDMWITVQYMKHHLSSKALPTQVKYSSKPSWGKPFQPRFSLVENYIVICVEFRLYYLFRTLNVRQLLWFLNVSFGFRGFSWLSL